MQHYFREWDALLRVTFDLANQHSAERIRDRTRGRDSRAVLTVVLTLHPCDTRLQGGKLFRPLDAERSTLDTAARTLKLVRRRQHSEARTHTDPGVERARRTRR